MKKEKRQFGKPKGTYVTIDIKKLKIATEEEIEEAREAFSRTAKRNC